WSLFTTNCRSKSTRNSAPSAPRAHTPSKRKPLTRHQSSSRQSSMQELIADLPLDDRPREKMRMHGPESLSDAELIALLLGSGTRGKNAIQLARELLRDGLRTLGSSSADAMAKTSGVGLAKATRIGAAVEIARRLESSEPFDGCRC